MKTSERIRSRLSLRAHQDVLLTDEERYGLDCEIDSITNSVAQSANVDEANDKLDELGLLQELMATLLFKHKVQLSEKQRNVVRRFDRFDDSDLRKHVFRAIKNGNFV